MLREFDTDANEIEQRDFAASRHDQDRPVMFDLSASQIELRAEARTFARKFVADRAAEVDSSEAYPWDNVEKLTQHRFMGMTVPKSLGGRGASYLDAVLVVEEMAKACGVTGRIVVEGNMGAIGAILAYGSDEQRRIAAAHVVGGDKPAICITEPDAGSAATEMQTRAVKTGSNYVLNGTKHWITGGGVSKLHLIFARLIEDGQDRGIAGFMAFRDQDEGLVTGKREFAMGLRGIPETEIHCRDLVLSVDRLILPPEGVKRGFAGLMTAYNAQRVGAAAVALGIAQGAYEHAVAFAKSRTQFGRPIAEFQGLQWMLADMRISLDAARLMVWRAAASAGNSDTGFPHPTLAAEAKTFTSEAAIKVANDALQIHGARGYGRSLPMERMARDARMFTIGGGTAQMLRNLIASDILDMKLPQTRDGFARAAADEPCAG